MYKLLCINNIWVLFITVLILSSCGTPPKTAAVQKKKKQAPRALKSYAVDFRQNSTLNQVLDEASASQKLVFIDFYADWCAPCQMMDRDVFMHEPTADFLNKNFVNYKVNTEQGNGPDLSVIYSIKVLPTILFLDDHGNVLERKDGAAYHTELLRMANRALETIAGL